MNFRFNNMIIIRNNKETFASSKCSLTYIVITSINRGYWCWKKAHVPYACFFELWVAWNQTSIDVVIAFFIFIYLPAPWLYMYWLNIVRIACLFVRARQQITNWTKWLQRTIRATSAIRVSGSVVKFAPELKRASNSAQYWQVMLIKIISFPFPSFWHRRGFLSECKYTEGFTGKKSRLAHISRTGINWRGL